MRKIFFVYNPHSGKGKLAKQLDRLTALFGENGYEVNVHPTEAAGDAIAWTKEVAADHDLILVSGGDGTLNEAVTGLLQSGCHVPIGYIPSGSTNDFGSSIGMSTHPLEAARSIISGQILPCDIGTLNQKPFVYIAAFGMFTDIAYKTSQSLKHVLGHTAYLLEIGKEMFRVPSYHMTLRMGDVMIEDDFAYGMITNTTSVGGMKHVIGQDVALDDGLFEVTLVRTPKNPIEFHVAVNSLLFGQKKSPLILQMKAHRLSIQADTEVAWTLDGEYGGDHDAVVIENQRRAVSFLHGVS